MASSPPTTSSRRSSTSSNYDEEVLDPRVQVELEKLNHATDAINRLELELDEARGAFRQMLTESAVKLNALSKKLGSCIEKARPYYEARMQCKWLYRNGRKSLFMSVGVCLSNKTCFPSQAKRPRWRLRKPPSDSKEPTACMSRRRKW